MTKGSKDYTNDLGDGGNSRPHRESVGQRLREARIAAGMTQVEAGRRTGISPVSIFRHERGENLPRQMTLAALARVYGRPLAWFTGEAFLTSGPEWHGGLGPGAGPDSDVEVVGIPLVAGMAGIGVFALDETPMDWYPFRQDRLVAAGTCARFCSWVEVRGDSMSRRCPSGSRVLVDASRLQLEDGTIYLMTDPTDGLVVRQASQDGHRWVVVADHPGWRPRNYTDAWQVHGRVLLCQILLG